MCNSTYYSLNRNMIRSIYPKMLGLRVEAIVNNRSDIGVWKFTELYC
jgi:hypothetical protein